MTESRKNGNWDLQSNVPYLYDSGSFFCYCVEKVKFSTLLTETFIYQSPIHTIDREDSCWTGFPIGKRKSKKCTLTFTFL